jgi:hypothetical protein
MNHLRAVINRLRGVMSHLGEVFDDWLTRIAGITFVLTVALVIFNVTSGLLETHPLIALATFSLVPVLFIVGGIAFLISIVRLVRRQ